MHCFHCSDGHRWPAYCLYCLLPRLHHTKATIGCTIANLDALYRGQSSGLNHTGKTLERHSHRHFYPGGRILFSMYLLEAASISANIPMLDVRSTAEQQTGNLLTSMEAGQRWPCSGLLIEFQVQSRNRLRIPDDTSKTNKPSQNKTNSTARRDRSCHLTGR